MENISNLVKAVISVMKEVKNIDKNLNVGAGQNSYKGVADKDVKNIIGSAMAKNGLSILPIEVIPHLEVNRWEEQTNYGAKMRQAVFTEVKTKYLLLHESGESIELSGYGHGVDAQDKSAGKATTYALKYTLLYTFLVPTGEIDDSDKTHSDNIQVPVENNAPQKTQDNRPSLTDNSETFLKALESVKSGKVTLAQIERKYKISKEVKAKLTA